MYYNLISTLKRRIILELQDGFSKHPQYSKLVPYIQNKYAFDQRPPFGIVIKGSSANKVQLSANNFIASVISHVMLAYVDQPSFMLEWVKEDVELVRSRGDVFPTSPGVYYLECLTAPTTENETGYYVIDPLLTITGEPLIEFSSGLERDAQLQNTPVEQTLRIWLDGSNLLTEGTDYTVDYADGRISLLGRFYPGATLTADYRYASPSIGPVPFYWNQADFETLPGVVLAFGKRAQVGDKVAVVVYPDRVETAHAYGGKFEVTFEMDCIALDPMQMEEIADYAIMHLWAEKKAILEFEGLEILDVNMSGEAEDTYDETGDTYYYTAALSVQLRADWEIHQPLPLTISKISTTSNMVGGNLLFATVPIIPGRNNFYERIG